MKKKGNFIKYIIENDIRNGRDRSEVITRFPPEPNGFLHIGHLKAISVDFGIAEEYGTTCRLRLDDTNPMKEDTKYVNAIQEDIKWLGYDWKEHIHFASDYFDTLYGYAIKLIKDGNAFVCELTAQEMRDYRGTLTTPGKNSPYRDRPIEESLKLFEGMKNGEFENGKYILRAKIDMTHPNMNMRDPAIYRIANVIHHRTGDKWHIYPMYDFAHPLSDAIEEIRYSLCTLEFEDHRPIYNWYVEKVNPKVHPRQIEFARLELTYTMMSKRKLKLLVDEGLVNSWDDPRMPTISGLRRKGYTPNALKAFTEMIGVAKANSLVDIEQLEFAIRDDLNKIATRVMAVLDPVKLIIDNYPEDKVELFDAENNPEDKSSGTRKIPFSKELYIEREDFMEDAPKKFFRLTIGGEVRLKHAYYVKCTNIVKDDEGNITEIHCTYDPETRTGWFKGIRKVKGTLHWVSAKHAYDAKVNLYENLFSVKEVGKERDFREDINPNSLKTIVAKVEPSLKDAKPEEKFQFLRKGYFTVDLKDSKEGAPVFNRTVSLKSSYKPK